ncbi:MAG: hypothetical protein AB7H66_02165 [Hyphomonadaceae bacterium]
MRMPVLAALTALGACATPLPQVVEREGDTFDVRYDPAAQTAAEADEKANVHCSSGAAGYVSQQTGFDGFTYRTYRCAVR